MRRSEEMRRALKGRLPGLNPMNSSTGFGGSPPPLVKPRPAKTKVGRSKKIWVSPATAVARKFVKDEKKRSSSVAATGGSTRGGTTTKLSGLLGSQTDVGGVPVQASASSAHE